MSPSSLQNSDPHNNLPGSVRPDRRLSVLEVCVLSSVLVCVCLAVVITMQTRLEQTQTDRLAASADAVSSWVAKAHAARKEGAGLEPVRCNTDQYQPLLHCFSDMVSSGQPFAGLKNALNAASDAPAFAFVAAADSIAAGQPCATLPGPVHLSAPAGASKDRPQDWAGIIIAKTSALSDDLSLTVNRLDIGFCDRNGILVWTSRSAVF